MFSRPRNVLAAFSCVGIGRKLMVAFQRRELANSLSLACALVHFSWL